MAESSFHKFIGVSRWRELSQALRRQSEIPASPAVSTVFVLLALVIALSPITVAYMMKFIQRPPIDLPTISLGIAAVAAMMFRSRLGLQTNLEKDLRSALGLTHTAFALGCIPAVLLLAASPELLAKRHDLIAGELLPPVHAELGFLKMAVTGGYLLFVAFWAAITEEVIFRGLLVSVIRRWSIFKSQQNRDVTAVVVSASIFGLSHYLTWGPIAALALVGLGLGFVIAYLAIGEKLLPVIIYHFVFDALSIFVSILV